MNTSTVNAVPSTGTITIRAVQSDICKRQDTSFDCTIQKCSSPATQFPYTVNTKFNALCSLATEFSTECSSICPSNGTRMQASGRPTNGCPLINGIGPSSSSFVLSARGEVEIVTGTSNADTASAEITCNYDPSIFTDPATVQSWINTVGMDDNWKNVIMPTFCQGVSTNCVTDPRTNMAMPRCSFFQDRGQPGTLCNQWLSALEVSGERAKADPVFLSFCARNTDPTDGQNSPPDCGCINRNSDPVYAELSKLPGLGDEVAGCWYIPCKTPETFLITSNILVEPNNPSACPSTICVDINQFIASGDSSITTGEINQTIDCPNGNGGGGGMVPNTFWKRYRWWIIGGIVLFIIIIAFLIIFGSRKK